MKEDEEIRRRLENETDIVPQIAKIIHTAKVYFCEKYRTDNAYHLLITYMLYDSILELVESHDDDEKIIRMVENMVFEAREHLRLLEDKKL